MSDFWWMVACNWVLFGTQILLVIVIRGQDRELKARYLDLEEVMRAGNLLCKAIDEHVNNPKEK